MFTCPWGIKLCTVYQNMRQQFCHFDLSSKLGCSYRVSIWKHFRKNSINTGVCVSICFQKRRCEIKMTFFNSDPSLNRTRLVDVVASCNSSGNPLIQLGFLSLVDLSHTQFYDVSRKMKTTSKIEATSKILRRTLKMIMNDKI